MIRTLAPCLSSRRGARPDNLQPCTHPKRPPSLARTSATARARNSRRALLRLHTPAENQLQHIVRRPRDSSRPQLVSSLAAMESSRIFVRGLPSTFTEDGMRRHFGRYPITDVKFFPHRRIGYVGYKTPDDAAKAVKYFDKTFIKLTRIHAEIARPVSLIRQCDNASHG